MKLLLPTLALLFAFCGMARAETVHMTVGLDTETVRVTPSGGGTGWDNRIPVYKGNAEKPTPIDEPDYSLNASTPSTDRVIVDLNRYDAAISSLSARIKLLEDQLKGFISIKERKP